MTTIEKYEKYIMPTYGRYPLVIQEGKGRIAKDEKGMKYIDLGSGIGTNSLGYCNKDWAEAVSAQANTLQHSSNYYYTKVQADYAEKLCVATGYDKVFFCNSGAEANECAIKIARKYSFDKYGKDRNKILTVSNSFHGRTITTLSATGQDSFHNYFFPFTGGFDYVEPNNIDDLVKKADDSVCAIMFEFIQGESGVNTLDFDFISKIMEICRQKDIISIADEVQTGFGRTGRLLTSFIYEIQPDITTLAKGIAGGLPMGACLAAPKCSDVLSKGMHGSTFGGNPVACAGAVAVLKQINNDDFLSDVRKKGKYIKKQLENVEEVVSVSGTGLMIGIELKSKKASDIVEKALEMGVLLLTAKDKIRLLPPLNISFDELSQGLDILVDLLNEE